MMILGKARWLFVTVVLFSVVVSYTAADEGSGNMECDYSKSSLCRPVVEINTIQGKENPFAAAQNKKRSRHEKNEEEEEEERYGPPLKKLKTTDDLSQRTPDNNRTFRSPSLSSSPESIITHSNSQRSDKDAHPVSKKIPFDEDGCENASPESKLIQHLKKLSEMEPSLNKTDSLVFDLLTDSKFVDACIEIARGTKQLKEGLRTITKFRELLCERTKTNYN